jgi:hypothetical protein
MKQFVIGLLVLLLVGCSNELFNLMSRPDVPPFEDKPVVLSFKAPLKLSISWSKDIGADEYLLYRDTSPTGDFAAKVYSGTALNYTDNYVEDAKWYYYKLYKRRGKQIFTTNYYGYGVASFVIKDDFENNDTIDCATHFEPIKGINENIYYYKDGVGNIIYDSDWYWVSIEAETQMTISFKNYVNIDSEGICYKDKIDNPDPLALNEEKTLENKGPTDKVFYFQIIPSASAFFDENAGGGKIGRYQIAWDNNQPIVR